MPGSSEVQQGAAVRAGVNVRFTAGDWIESRPCYVHTGQYNRYPHHLSELDPPKHTGAGAYVDPATGVPYVILAADGLAAPAPGAMRQRRVWLCRSDAGPQELPPPHLQGCVSIQW